MSRRMNLGDDDDDFTPRSAVLTSAVSFASDDADDEFSPADRLSAAALVDVSPASMFRELFNRAAGKDQIGVRPSADCTVQSHIHYCQIIAAMGKKNMITTALGEVSPADMAAIASVSTSVIMAALTKPKVIAISTFTDLSVVDLAVQFAGVSIYCADQIPRIAIPGTKVVVVVSREGPTRGRAVSGGAEFLQFLSVMKCQDIRFVKVNPIARALARWVLAARKVTLGDEMIYEATRSAEQTSKYHKLAIKEADVIESYFKPMFTHLQKAYADVSNRPNLGRSKAKLDYVEVLLHNYIEKASESLKMKMAKFVDMVFEDLEMAMNTLRRSAHPLFDLTDKGIPVSLDAIRGETAFVEAHTNTPLATWGNYGEFVEGARSRVRTAGDLPRKSDANGLGYVADAPSSCPSKFQHALSQAKEILDLPADAKIGKVDAFGTGSNNWFAKEVEAVATHVVYHDRLVEYDPKDGRAFKQMDIRNLVKGSGVGKGLVDDTMDIPEKHTETNKTQVREKAKIDKIVEAGYDWGVTKLYLGGFDDSKERLYELPYAVKTVTDNYHRVVLADGGSVHSPEYFCVFAERKLGTKESKWIAPRLQAQKDGTRKYQPFFGSTKIPRADWNRDYLETWLSLKVLFSVQSNLLLNVQVLRGCYNGQFPKSWLAYDVERVQVNGKETFSSQVSEPALAALTEVKAFRPRVRLGEGEDESPPEDSGGDTATTPAALSGKPESGAA